MGGFFGAVSKRDTVMDVFFGTDYHSHLGTRRGGMAAWDPERGFQRDIHNIENAPFRTKFAHILDEMRGNICIGSISDTDPQPLLVRSQLGTFAISTVGIINNADAIISELLMKTHGHFESMSGSRINSNELAAALISCKDSFEEGIRYAQEVIDGTLIVLIMTEDRLIAARDKFGRLPVQIGQDDDGCCVCFEPFAYQKLGYHDVYKLGPGEIVELTADGYKTLAAAHKQMKICAFLWTYYGYPNSNYEGVNVEIARCRNGAIMARNDAQQGKVPDVDMVSGMPDSGTPHAIGYANESGIQFARPFIKYTPTWSRSFTPVSQKERAQVAEMKQIPVPELIEGKKILLIDDSIVRGTQLKETVDFFNENGVKEIHIRAACPPIAYGCKYINFSRSKSEMELLVRKLVMQLEGEVGMEHLDEYIDGSTERGKKLRQTVCEQFHCTSLDYQSLDGMLEAIGIDPCEVCTYCWTGKE